MDNRFILGIAIILVVVLLLPFVLWWGWNESVSPLLNVPRINNWLQAFALILVANILIKPAAFRGK